MIRFFTAAFGEAYARVTRGLLRSFERFAPKSDITVFTDMPAHFQPQRTIRTSFDDVLAELDSFLRAPDGQLRNAFKFVLFRRMQQLFPGDDVCWIDADMLVFSELSQHLVPGRINVMAHGRRDDQVIACGNGLNVPGSRYAIGGLYSLPPGPALDFLFEIARQRPQWRDVDRLVLHSGDQITLNHLVARSGLPVHWLSDDRRFIYNLEIGEAVHPVVGDPALAAVTLQDGRPVRQGRTVAVFCWIKTKLDAHLVNEFATFKPEVAALLKTLYRTA